VLGRRHLGKRRVVCRQELLRKGRTGSHCPYDLRRTCAKLCHSNGGELEQIQFLLGHASVQTTERYLGCKQNLGQPVNDRFAVGSVPSSP
jgi:integrase